MARAQYPIARQAAAGIGRAGRSIAVNLASNQRA
jgi:hypothetical protein